MHTLKIPLIANYQAHQSLIESNNNVITQQQFLSHAIVIAEQLPDTQYIINLCNDRYYFALGFAAAIIKGLPTLLPPNRQPGTIATMTKKYKNCFIIANTDIASNVSVLNLSLFKSSAVNHKTIDKAPEIAASLTVAIAFTSGSTGTPRPHKKCWRTLCGTVQRLARRFQLNRVISLQQQQPYIIATVPSQHMYGLEMTVMMALQGQCVMVSSQPFFPADVEFELQRIRTPYLLVTTPVHLRALVRNKIKAKVPQRIISATAPLPTTLARAAESLFDAKVNEIYGCTEAGSLATRHTTRSDTWALLDDLFLSLEEGTTYVDGPHLTQKTQLQDQIEICMPTQFKFLGRASDLLNVGGKRASLGELTHLLMAIDGVDDAIVFLNNKTPARPAAFVVTEKTEQSVLNELSKKIDPVFLPRPLKKIHCIPRNETGKVSCETLRKLLK
ncbi:MAG: AMP-binding protein [Gammaproteobacteria bacterium]|nr:AMP-binding protein [Gammaproteobacteria bacterium]